MTPPLMDGDTMFRRWRAVLSAAGEVEQLGLRWDAGPDGEPPIPQVVWRLGEPDGPSLARYVQAIRDFEGQVPWQLIERGEHGINWSLTPRARTPHMGSSDELTRTAHQRRPGPGRTTPEVQSVIPCLPRVSDERVGFHAERPCVFTRAPRDCAVDFRFVGEDVAAEAESVRAIHRGCGFPYPARARLRALLGNVAASTRFARRRANPRGSGRAPGTGVTRAA